MTVNSFKNCQVISCNTEYLVVTRRGDEMWNFAETNLYSALYFAEVPYTQEHNKAKIVFVVDSIGLL